MGVPAGGKSGCRVGPKGGQLAAWRARLVVSVAVLALLTSGCSGEAIPARDLEAVDEVDARIGLAVLDESIPAVDVHGDYWPEYDDLRSITCASDIAFIGRVTGYTERLLTVPPDPEDPDPSRRSDVLEGLVFTVDELLIGDPGGSAEVTVAFWALTVNEDGSPHSRVVGAPFEVIRPGIEQRGDPEGPLYLVYAVASEAHSPFDVPGVYYFKTNGGVTAVLADGSLDVGADRPFRSGHGLGVEDAWEAALAAKRLCVKPPLPAGARETWYNQGAGADALWRMTAVPLSGACPWHYPPGTFEPEFFEHMKEIRRAALARESQS